MEQWRRDGNNGNGWHDGNGDGDGDGRHSGDSNGRWNGNTGAATMMGGTTATQRQQRRRARRGKSGDLQGGYLRYRDNLLPCQKSLSQNGARLLQGVTRVPLKMAQGFPRSQQMASTMSNLWNWMFSGIYFYIFPRFIRLCDFSTLHFLFHAYQLVHYSLQLCSELLLKYPSFSLFF